MVTYWYLCECRKRKCWHAWWGFAIVRLKEIVPEQVEMKTNSCGVMHPLSVNVPCFTHFSFALCEV